MRDITYHLTKVKEMSVREAERTKISGPVDLLPMLQGWAHEEVECFVVAFMDGGQQTMSLREITRGLINRTLSHPREVFRPAVQLGACSVILIHNHPSGTLAPSKEDKEATQRLMQAGKLLGIEVLDHLIVARDGYYSFRENGDVFL